MTSCWSLPSCGSAASARHIIPLHLPSAVHASAAINDTKMGNPPQAMILATVPIARSSGSALRHHNQDATVTAQSSAVSNVLSTTHQDCGQLHTHRYCQNKEWQQCHRCPRSQRLLQRPHAGAAIHVHSSVTHIVTPGQW